MVGIKVLPGHAVRATEVASVRDRNTKVVERPFVAVHESHGRFTLPGFLNLYYKGSWLGEPTRAHGRAWVKRWSPHRNGGKGSFVPALNITSNAAIESMTWKLPPSKSHAIRWLALAAQSNQPLRLHNMAAAGQDIVSMRRCLRQLGVRITDLDASGHPIPVESNHDDQPPIGTVSWDVVGAGPHGLRAPVSVLHAGNSGTALRILMAMCARFDVPLWLTVMRPSVLAIMM